MPKKWGLGARARNVSQSKRCLSCNDLRKYNALLLDTIEDLIDNANTGWCRHFDLERAVERAKNTIKS